MLASRIHRCCSSLSNSLFTNQSTRILKPKSSLNLRKSSSTPKTSSSTNSSTNAAADASRMGMLNEYLQVTRKMGPNMYYPNNFERWLLVWMKKYPKGQVPKFVTMEQMYQTKSRARIKIANRMMLGTAIVFIGVIIFAKSLREKGDSIDKRNKEWHRKINEEHEARVKTQQS